MHGSAPITSSCLLLLDNVGYDVATNHAKIGPISAAGKKSDQGLYDYIAEDYLAPILHQVFHYFWSVAIHNFFPIIRPIQACHLLESIRYIRR